MWDPDQYGHFGGERSRPFFDLVGRVAAKDPAVVVDLGCGPGTLTAALARRWPGAEVRGVDSSPEMIRAAQAMPAENGQRLSFALGDVRDWEPTAPVDVIVSNAVLQWVPGHLSVLARWAGFLNAGGWLAIQVPGNFDQPSHMALREMIGSGRWRPLLAGAELNRSVASPGEYLDLLAGKGFEVDAWETTYLHVLHGNDAVVDWYKGTGLRPVLAELNPDQAAEFLADYRDRMAAAYPAAPYGTPFPFRRVFAVAVRP
jgi:trans-aconitate 2-methyltransferase